MDYSVFYADNTFLPPVFVVCCASVVVAGELSHGISNRRGGDCLDNVTMLSEC